MTTNEAVVLTGPQVERFQLLALRTAIKLEMRGLHLSRGHSATAQARKLLIKRGYKLSARSPAAKLILLLEKEAGL